MRTAFARIEKTQSTLDAFVAVRDEGQVERLRAAGAIVIGRTNAPEFGYTAITKNLLFGESRNPWNLDRTPGGSSGGASAAIAGGVVSLATASDGGGSVRIPASVTGCFGLKGSFGRVPHGPKAMWIMDDTAVDGPLTRWVRDAALHLDAVVGAHPDDPNSLPAPRCAGSQRDRAALRRPPSHRVLARPRLRGGAERDVAARVRDALDVFAAEGHLVEEIRGGPPEPGADWLLSGACEALAELSHLLPDHEQEFGRSRRRTSAASPCP